MGDNESVTLELTLTRAEWAEVANAVESKACLIERGDYGEREGLSDNPIWIAVLRAALGKITEVFENNGVSW